MTTARERNEARRAALGIERLQDVKVPLSDGNYLLADVFRPKNDQKHPVILRLGVYGRAFDCGSACDEEAELASEEREDAWFERRKSPLVTPMDFYETMVTANASDWVPRGYVCVRVDARGVGKVPGVIDPLSKQEAQDYLEVIEWAARQPWSNGVVGLYGGSYNANTAWIVAGLRPPSLKAIIPFAGDIDLYRELAHPGGLEMTGFLDTWLDGNVKGVQGREPEVVDLLGRVRANPFNEPEKYGPYGDVLCSTDLANIEVPLLTSVCLGAPVHGRGGAEAFLTAVNAPHKELIVVDANYWPFMYRDCLDQQYAFFDRHLKGDLSSPHGPPVKYIMRFGDGNYEWREDTMWPLSNAEFLELYLDASNQADTNLLSFEAPTSSGVSTYSAEAPSTSTEPGPCAIFESGPLTEDIEIAGPMSAVLWVSASAKDMDLYVVFSVLDSTDKEVSYAVMPLAQGCPLSHGVLKVSHRKTDPERSTAWRPWHTHLEKDYAPLVPNEVVSIHVEMTLTTARVNRGHRFQVIIEPYSGHSEAAWRAYGGIASGEAQAKDNRDTVGGRFYDSSYHVGVENRIHTGPNYPSKLLIPSISGKYAA